MNKITKVYETLLDSYGPQGWWPLMTHKGVNPTKTGSITGYHPGDYSFPKNEQQMFEICCGAILTQNTSWTSVEKSLKNIKNSGGLTIKNINKLSDGKLRELIKPAGYYNQKANYLREFIKFFENSNGVPARSEVLEVKGIGPETADSIMLYAYKQTEFVVDAYTKRIMHRLGIIEKYEKYDSVKQLFQDVLTKDVQIYQEYHALLVEHAKRHCLSRNSCSGCPLGEICRSKQ